MTLDTTLLRVIRVRSIELVRPSRHPFNAFDLTELVQMRQATDGIGRLADKVEHELPILVDRIKQIGATPVSTRTPQRPVTVDVGALAIRSGNGQS